MASYSRPRYAVSRIARTSAGPLFQVADQHGYQVKTFFDRVAANGLAHSLNMFSVHHPGWEHYSPARKREVLVEELRGYLAADYFTTTQARAFDVRVRQLAAQVGMRPEALMVELDDAVNSETR